MGLSPAEDPFRASRSGTWKAGKQREARGRSSGRHQKGVSRKEVFQPHLPVRLPCYDLAPITGFTLGRPLRSRTSGAPGFHGLTGGVYKARERIHRAMADARFAIGPGLRTAGALCAPL